MKIAFILKCFPQLTETFVLNQIKDFLNSGAEVWIIACYPISDNLKLTEDLPVQKVIYLSSSNNFFIRNLRHLSAFKKLTSLQKLLFCKCFAVERKLNDITDFDYIIAHFGQQGVLALRLRDMGLLSSKIATFFHGYDLSRYLILNLYQSAYRELFKRTEIILPISDFWRRKLLTLGCAEQSAITQHLGVNTNYYQYQPKTNLSSPLLIISVARLTEKKGLSYAIKAVADLSQKVDVEYMIIGAGGLHDSLASLIKDLNA